MERTSAITAEEGMKGADLFLFSFSSYNGMKGGVTEGEAGTEKTAEEEAETE